MEGLILLRQLSYDHFEQMAQLELQFYGEDS